MAARYDLTVAPGATETVLLRLAKGEPRDPAQEAAAIFAARIREADTFYATLTNGTLDDDEALVQRQAFAGLIWCKQWYHYDVAEWLDGDPASGPPSDAPRCTAATATGASSTTTTSCRCPTPGSTRGTRRGTSPSTACRWPSSTRPSPSASC